MSTPPITKATGSWLDRFSPSQRRIGKIASAALIGFIILLSLLQYHHHSKPTYVLEVIDSIHSPADLDRYHKYFTPQGKEILRWAMAQAKNKPSSGSKLVYSEPVISGDVCDIPVHDEKVSIKIRLIKTSRWQFNDIYFETAGGKSIDIWASYLKDHPYMAWLAVNWSDLLGAFVQGFMIGIGAGK